MNMNFTRLRLRCFEVALVIAIIAQGLAVIIIYESTFHAKAAGRDAADAGEPRDNHYNATPAAPAPSAPGRQAAAAQEVGNPNGEAVLHTTANPGGLILTSSFSYMQDPREVNRKRPLPHILPTFENMYHFHTTVLHHGLHAIVFHDDYSFNQTFVNRHTSDYIKFVRIEAPTFDHGEPVISPNDFRFVVFDKYLRDNLEVDDHEIVKINGINYEWYMIADLDVFFQRNPFPKLDDYAQRGNITFFGSWDGGTWENENMRLQRRLFRNCYGRPMLLTWREEVEWSTPNGNCGLWAGRFPEVSCILSCMAHQYDKPPVRGKGSSTICDMATHDYCVHYGGCFPGSKIGIYDEKKVGVLWGEESMGKSNDLFGPPYGRYRQCDKNTWTVVHNRCDWKGPLCFRKDEEGNLVKYHQNVKGRKCRLDPYTDVPLENPEEIHS